MKNLLKRLVAEEQGQDVIEYALLAAGISIAASFPTRAADRHAVLNAVYNNILAAVAPLGYSRLTVADVPGGSSRRGRRLSG